MSYMQPFTLNLDFATGALSGTQVAERRLSQMRHMYLDEAAEAALLAQGDPVIYEVHLKDAPNESGHLLTCTTVIHPGKVGNEFYMTKGHFHARPGTSEFYIGLRGHGKLLMEVDGQFESVDLDPGVVAYIPPYWAHRTVNTGAEDFIFLSFWPADAGHNYGAIERTGFAYCVVADGGEVKLVPNPKHGA